jgi:sulfatase maturation enzyme AslB (radical SAM superfamily)
MEIERGVLGYQLLEKIFTDANQSKFNDFVFIFHGGEPTILV